LTETIINLESVNPIDFFGVNNNKFDLLKKKFPLLKILSRGTQIKLSGAPEQIDIAKENYASRLLKETFNDNKLDDMDIFIDKFINYYKDMNSIYKLRDIVI
jgi:phosphate starvation-inducible protein PhoH